MPRITELPLPSPNALTGNESIAVVQDGKTVQSKIYRARYSRMLPSTNKYLIAAFSYDVNLYVSFAEMKFYQDGMEIPSTSIVSIEFVGAAPLSLTGSLANVIDGDPETYVRFQHDIVGGGAIIEVTFDSASIVVDEIRVTAPSLASGVNMLECPAVLSVISSGADGSPDMQYSFSTYDDPSNNWGDAWVPGQTKTLISPEILSNPYVPRVEVSSVTPFSIPQVYASVRNCDNIIFKFPRVALNVNSMANNIPGIAGANGLPVKLGSASLEIEVLAHRENTATILANTNPEDNTLSQSFYQSDKAYTANTLVFRNNGTSDVTLILVPGKQFVDLFSPLHSKKTLINTSPTYSVTLDVSAFTTVIGSDNLVVPPLSVVHFMEYDDGEIAVWK